MVTITSPIIKVFLLFFCILSSTVLLAEQSASQELSEFSITASEHIEALRCMSVTEYVRITNTLLTNQVYELTPDGSAATWVTLTPTTFSLVPGQTQLVREDITLPCKASRAKQFLIHITTPTIRETIVQEIIPQTPLNLDFTVQPLDQTISPCGTGLYSLLIKNPADFEETYTLSTTLASSEFSNTTITLQPNISSTVSLWIKPQDCTFSGMQEFVVRARTKKTALIAEQQLSLFITSRGIADIAPRTRTIRTTLAKSNANISLTNKGAETTTYSLTLSGADWVQITTPTIILSGNSIGNVGLHFSPLKTIREGYWPVVINAKAENTGNTYSKKIYVFLERDSLLANYVAKHWLGLLLMIFVFVVVLESTRRIANYTNTDFYKELKKQRAIIKQKKAQQRAKEKEQLKKQNQKQAELRKKEELKKIKYQEQLSLKKQVDEKKAKERSLHDAERILREKYEFVPKKEVQSSSRKTLLAIMLVIILAAGIWLGYPNRALLWQNKAYVLIGSVSSLVFILLVWLVCFCISLRKHSIFQAYLTPQSNIIIKGWKKGIDYCVIRNTEAVAKPCILFEKGAEVALPPAQLVFKSYQLRTTFLEQVHSVGVSFSVQKKWLAKQNASKRSVSFKHFVDKEWKNVPVKIVAETSKEYFFTCQPATTGNYAICAQANTLAPPKPSKKALSPASKRAIIGIALLCVLFATVLTTYLLSAPAPFQPSLVGIPSQAWYANSQESINLSQYFKDPDNDKLTYTIKIGQHMSVEVKNNIALLTPEKDWTGQTYVVFAADDNKGGLVVSNAVTLIVSRPVISPVLMNYAKPVLIGIILIILILFVIFYNRQLKDFLMKD